MREVEHQLWRNGKGGGGGGGGATKANCPGPMTV